MATLTSSPRPQRVALPQYRASASPAPINPRQTFLNAPRQRVIAPAFQAALFAPLAGVTWLRILPPHLKSLVFDWLYNFQVWDLAPRSAGFVPEIAVPSSLVGSPAVEDRIQIFSRFVGANYPQLLRAAGPEAPAPLALFQKDRAVCWTHVVRQGNGSTDSLPVRLWYGSYYAGNAALRPGYLRTLADLCFEKVATLDGPARPRYGDISHPKSGRLVAMTMDRLGNGGVNFNGFSVADQQSPIAAFARVYAAHPAFQTLNVPIEQTVQCPTAEVIKETLEKYLAWQVRNGQATEVVYEAYRRCFGHDVAEEHRFGEFKRQAAAVAPVLPVAELPVTPELVKKAPAAKKQAPSHRIEDDLGLLPFFEEPTK